jgi:fructose-bisphosphate aldolase class II
VSQGIVKVNIGTILNVAFTGAIRTHLDHHPDVVDPRKYLTPARDDLAAVVTRMIAAVAAPSS